MLRCGDVGEPRGPLYHFSFSAPCGATTALCASAELWPAILCTITKCWQSQAESWNPSPSTLGTLGMCSA